jgi:hypothetical protein
MQTTFLESQIRLYGQQSGELESSMRSHLQAMHCSNLEDVIGLGLHTLESMKRHNRKWSADVRSGETEFSWDDAERFAKAYGDWLQATRAILDAVALCEGRGFEVNGADRLRAASQDVSLMSLNTERLRASVESLQQGRGIPHATAMNELRDNLRRARIRRPA